MSKNDFIFLMIKITQKIIKGVLKMAKQIEEMNKEELINFINSENEKIESANIEIQKHLKKINIIKDSIKDTEKNLRIAKQTLK